MTALRGVAERADLRRTASVALLLLLHAAALIILFATEGSEFVQKLAFVLTWGALNFLLLVLLRRPVAAAALSLAAIAVLIELSKLKHSVLFLTVNFLDLMIIDSETFRFLFKVYPGLRQAVALAVAVAVPILLVLWWLDTLRVRARTAILGSVV